MNKKIKIFFFLFFLFILFGCSAPIKRIKEEQYSYRSDGFQVFTLRESIKNQDRSQIEIAKNNMLEEAKVFSFKNSRTIYEHEFSELNTVDGKTINIVLRFKLAIYKEVNDYCINEIEATEIKFLKFGADICFDMNKYQKKKIENNLNKCDTNISNKKWNDCVGVIGSEFGSSYYNGEFRYGMREGFGYFKIGEAIYFGSWKNNKPHGYGIFLLDKNYSYKAYSGLSIRGKWENGELTKILLVNHEIGSDKFNAGLNIIKNYNTWGDVNNSSGGYRAESKKKIFNFEVFNSNPNSEGEFTINVQANSDTASLMINGEEYGGRSDGSYLIKKIARAGQETQFTIIARDTNGNMDKKSITVSRQITSSYQVKYAELNPAIIKTQINKDAVAIIIGIADYKNLPKADYANDDARIFYDYALRGLGVKAENIKLLVDGDADQIDIYKAFKTWLPSRVKSTTDIYVYYSGHGLPTDDGQGLYLLPQRADRDFIEKSAINQQEINSALQAVKPKSVTIFLDSCYSGLARTGQALLASARPIKLKASTQVFPAEFTVITASQADQISSSSPELKHGIFSYYLMKGMEGEADSNKDGKITVGEMHGYLAENVARQASLNNRIQQPQLSGDANRVLVGR